MATATPPTWTLGDRLRKARDTAGFTQGEMARYVGKNRATVISYEHDTTEPPATLVADWAVICDVPVEWLLGVTVTAGYTSEVQPVGRDGGREGPSFTVPHLVDRVLCGN